jgi:hypothetical protein
VDFQESLFFGERRKSTVFSGERRVIQCRVKIEGGRRVETMDTVDMMDTVDIMERLGAVGVMERQEA